jgi:hypothetical protein
MAQISGTVRPLKREGLGSGRPSGGVLAQPGVEVLWSLEVEQGNREGLERSEGKGLDAGLLAGGQGAAAVFEQAEGEGDGFGLAAFQETFLAAFLETLLKALFLSFLASQAKDFAIGDAASEVVDGDPTHGADLGNGATAEA